MIVRPTFYISQNMFERRVTLEKVICWNPGTQNIHLHKELSSFFVADRMMSRRSMQQFKKVQMKLKT